MFSSSLPWQQLVSFSDSSPPFCHWRRIWARDQAVAIPSPSCCVLVTLTIMNECGYYYASLLVKCSVNSRVATKQVSALI